MSFSSARAPIMWLLLVACLATFNPLPAQDLEVPESPWGLVATTVSSDTVELRWIDNSYNEDGFIIERKERYDAEFTPVFVACANASYFRDFPLQAGSLYYFQVSAFNSFGKSSSPPVVMAITFAKPIPDADSILIRLEDFKSSGRIRNLGLHNSIRVKVLAAREALAACDYVNAVRHLSAVLAETEAQKGKGIELLAADYILFDAVNLLRRARLFSSLPSDLTFCLTSSARNDVIILAADGQLLRSRFAGYRYIRVDRPVHSVASFSVIESEFIGSSVSIDGIDFGKIHVLCDANSPGHGRIDFATGQIEFEEHLTISSTLLRAMGLPPIPFVLEQRGVLSSIDGVVARMETMGQGTLPAEIPVLGGASITACESLVDLLTSESGSGTAVACGTLSSNTTIGTPQTDNAGNEISEIATPESYRLQFKWADGTVVYIGACKRNFGGNRMVVQGADVQPKDGKKDQFKFVSWRNYEKDADNNGDGNVSSGDYTFYGYDPATDTLTITEYNDDQPVGDPKVICPAPRSLAELDPPPQDHGICWYFRHFQLLLSRRTGTTWEYFSSNQGNHTYAILPGDSICVAGSAIVSAQVIGEAARARFGAWVVAEVSSSYVVYQATTSATITGSFGGFTLDSIRGVPGIILWSIDSLEAGAQGVVYGPAAARD